MPEMSSILLSICSRSLVAGTPLLLGTIGEIYAERSGIMNLGVEGMMAVGAISGFSTAYLSGSPWLGLLAAIAAGALLAAVHGIFTILLHANQVVSGLALTTLGLGLSGLFGKGFVGLRLSTSFTELKIPILADIPFLGDILFNRDPVFFLSIFLGLGLWILLFKTRWGLVIRSVGENPLASETMGIHVQKTRFWCVILGGALAGMAGGYLSLAYNPSWIEGMVSGRGWIVVALTMFALWNPLRAFLGAYLFGGIFVLQYFLQPLGISPNLLLMLPYIGTIAALLFSTSRAKRGQVSPPAALGVPYIKES